MIKRLILVLSLISVSLLSAKDYKDGELIIKFSSDVNESEYESIILNNLSWLGEVELKNYIRPQLLDAAKRKLNEKNNYKLQSNNRINNLSRIYYLCYSSPFDAKQISLKIESEKFIEYAEPVFIYELSDVPNDPRVQEQYHLESVEAFEAWNYVDQDRVIVIGVVDTGVDLDHEDLADNIFINPGEDGLDENGKNKRTNGIDDDENGFIDDFQGWDFSSQSDPRGEDNDPNPGNRHGTHVAGISSAVTNNEIGVAGINPYSKILPVKASRDLSIVNTIENGYEAVLYAAVAGSDVINCSWGGQGRSDAGKEVIETVTEMGSIVVAASGNNGSDLIIYPAGYDEVISVASTTSADRRSGFSNYSTTVDIAAPGSRIMATIPNNGYAALDGTSMASPVAAGVVSLILNQNPEYTPLDLREHLKATSDNIDSLYPGSIRGKMGKGRVNALRAITDENPKSILVKNIHLSDSDNDGAFEPGDEITMNFEVQNMLSNVKGLKFTADKLSITGPDLSSVYVTVGDLSRRESSIQEFTFTLPDEISFDYEIEIKIDFTDEESYETYEIVTFTANQSYRDISTNKILTTVNSKGHVGYNDFPDNLQGSGFTYENSPNVLFEGAMMISSTDQNLSDVARSESGVQKDDFFYENLISITEDDEKLSLKAVFSDSARPGKAGVTVEQEMMTLKDPEYENMVFIINRFTNIRNQDFEEFYSGYYFDWDIGSSGQNNICKVEKGIGVQYRVNDPSLPYVGAGIIIGTNFKVYALDNDGESSDNPGVYDGFTEQEKTDILRGTITRELSSETDASMIISTGPDEIKSGESIEVMYVLMGATDEQGLHDAYEKALEYWGVENNTSVKIENELSVFPNPVTSGIVTISSDSEIGGITVIDIEGNIWLSDQIRTETKSLDLNHLPPGSYFIRTDNHIHKISISK